MNLVIEGNYRLKQKQQRDALYFRREKKLHINCLRKQLYSNRYFITNTL